VQWAVLRLVATQSLLYCYLFIILGISLIPHHSTIPSSALNAGSILSWVLTSTVVVLLYHLPTPQVAILECKNYGFRGVFRAAEIAYSNLSTSLGLAFFSVSYFCLLKLLVDVLLRDSYPFWTKFLAYPPLVVSVIAMSIFWQVVYTLFYLSNSPVDLDKADAIQADMEAADINQPLLVSISLGFFSIASKILCHNSYTIIDLNAKFPPVHVQRLKILPLDRVLTRM